MARLSIESELVSEKTLSKLLEISEHTLRFWRRNNKGPKYIKLEGRVRYHRDDVNKWFESDKEETKKREEIGERNVG